MTRRTALLVLGGTLLDRSAAPGSCGAAPTADFEPLFDGNSLAGWTAMGGGFGTWRADARSLSARGGKNWLSTNRAYSDFDLRLQYRIERGGNSGVLLRAPHRGDPSYEGLEVQILDDDAPIYRGLKPEQYTGSIYGVIAARRGSAGQVGTWNRLRVCLVDQSIRVELNGTCVVDGRLTDHPPSIARRHPGLRRARGFIGLQAHETPVWFRNLMIRELG